jgi:hypothetical protein
MLCSLLMWLVSMLHFLRHFRVNEFVKVSSGLVLQLQNSLPLILDQCLLVIKGHSKSLYVISVKTKVSSIYSWSRLLLWLMIKCAGRIGIIMLYFRGLLSLTIFCIRGVGIKVRCFSLSQAFISCMTKIHLIYSSIRSLTVFRRLCNDLSKIVPSRNLTLTLSILKVTKRLWHTQLLLIRVRHQWCLLEVCLIQMLIIWGISLVRAYLGRRYDRLADI